MDGNNGFESGFRVAEKGQVFVVIELRMAEYVHGVSPHFRDRPLPL
ncbi:hypothetical protein D777_01772 [Marinobacter nitratireducens]|uniref:Uncharacterized protein n=1 Tax=Marinobacter nitratireducens TaxID=1137280 RepID=A0A072N381_9GAMM|nr:hypothetical protein D777_01772 [Marinobacter nitratireducens]